MVTLHMSCQKTITEKITEKKADYVLGLKENHPLFYQEVKDYFVEVLKESLIYSTAALTMPFPPSAGEA